MISLIVALQTDNSSSAGCNSNLSFCMWFALSLIIIIIIIRIISIIFVSTDFSAGTVSFLRMCLCYPCIWSACYALTFLLLLSRPWVVAGHFCFSSSHCWNVPPPRSSWGEAYIYSMWLRCLSYLECSVHWLHFCWMWDAALGGTEEC